MGRCRVGPAGPRILTQGAGIRVTLAGIYTGTTWPRHGRETAAVSTPTRAAQLMSRRPIPATPFQFKMESHVNKPRRNKMGKLTKAVGSPDNSAPPVITQEQLRRLVALECQAEELNALRKTITDQLYYQEVEIERGELTPFIKLKYDRVFSYGRLIESFGEFKANDIMENLVESPRRCLRIKDRSGAIVGWGKREKSD